MLAEPAVAHLVARGQPLTGLSTRGGWDLELVDPALMRGGPAGRASDIWALGVTLHLALTGYGLYPALVSADPMVAVRMYLRSQPEPDADLSDGEGPSSSARCNQSPGKRYETADEMAADIEQVAGVRRRARSSGRGDAGCTFAMFAATAPVSAARSCSPWC